MHAATIVLGALAAVVSAQQSSSSVLFFTHTPGTVTDGQPQALTWSTNDTSTPVTILLRQGPSNNLQTVQTLTTKGNNGQFVWTPCSQLPDGSNYALELTQGSQVNYFGPFTVQGASGSGTCAGLVSPSSSASASSSSASSTTMSSSKMTTASASLATGTGTGIARNATMSSATLSRSSTTSLTTSSSTTATNSGAGFQTTASASAKPTSGASLAGGSASGSALALVLGAVAAVFLG